MGGNDIETLTIHGGILWMEESMRYGTTFTFVLPFRQSMRVSASD